MVRPFLIAIYLTGVSLILGLTPTAAAEDQPDITNIGFVLYTKSFAPGTLNAR